ncbi:putative nuclease HARBI1 [Penaeus vannamei]|uniref:putative nuclease HARBI1 n=1 Tax=Penaeus vannamei TaxID=6689 RepID=UPI00387F92C9
MSQFSVIAGMPGVIGCVDGTHIPIRSPGGVDAELYRCRKGFFPLNPGSAHDARIFNESLLCEKLRSGSYKCFLLGDSGYPCRSYILTPFGNPSTDKQSRYNSSHIYQMSNLILKMPLVSEPRLRILFTFGTYILLDVEDSNSKFQAN